MTSSDPHLLVRFKLKGEKKNVTISMTEHQYINFLDIPVIEECKIIGTTKKSLSEHEKKQVNERIQLAIGNEIGKKYLLQ